MWVGFGYTQRHLCEWQTLASPGRWPFADLGVILRARFGNRFHTGTWTMQIVTSRTMKANTCCRRGSLGPCDVFSVAMSVHDRSRRSREMQKSTRSSRYWWCPTEGLRVAPVCTEVSRDPRDVGASLDRRLLTSPWAGHVTALPCSLG